MGRKKLTDEELKANKKARNKECYEANKGSLAIKAKAYNEANR